MNCVKLRHGASRIAYRSATDISRLRLRCMASRRDDRDKTWGEILEDAAEVAKSAVGKLVDSGKQAMKALKRSDRPKRSIEDRGGYLDRPGGLFNGAIEGMLGGMMKGVINTIDATLAEAQRQTRDVYDLATERVEGDSEVESALGTVSFGPVFSQSSSTESINGVTRKKTALEFPVSGTKGSGVVSVDAKEGPDRETEMDIKVVLQSGRAIRVDGGGRSGGRTIDVDWKDV